MRKAIGDYLDLTKSVQEFGVTAQASAREASTLIGVARTLGIETSSLSGAFAALKSAAANHPEQFKALGIALQDADGNARPLIEVFTDLRARLADAGRDAGTLQLMQELLGTQYRELLPLLGLTADEFRNMQDRVAELGGVIDEQGIAKAQEFRVQVAELEATWTSFANTFGQTVVPGLVDALQGLGQAFDTYGSVISSFWENVIQGGAHALSGGALGTAFRNPLDVVGEAMDAAQRRHDEQVARTQRTAAAIVNASTRGGGPSLGSATQRALGGGRDVALDGLRDRIDAIRDEAAERERAMRAALDLYDREKDVVISVIEAEQRARERQHDLELRAIEDETRAREEAFEAIDRGRSDEIDALREQIRGTQELEDLERARQDIADAESDAERERKVEIFRSAGQSANDYGRAVRDQQRRIADADKRVAEAKKKLEEDTAKVAIEARIRAIEEERQGSRRALEEQKRGADDRLLAIRDQMQVERDQADAQLSNIRQQMELERQKTDDAIEQLQDETRVTLAELDSQVKGHQRAAAAIAPAWDVARRVSRITTRA